MDSILHYLQQIPADHFLTGLVSLLTLTTLGVFPNNAELTIAASSMLAPSLQLPIYQVILACFTGMFFGNSFCFLIGHYLRDTVLKWKWIQKRLTTERQDLIQKKLLESPLAIIINVQITPPLRPQMYMGLAIGRMRRKDFFIRMPLFLICYVSAIAFVFHQAGETILHSFREYRGPLTFSLLFAWVAVIVLITKWSIKRHRPV